MAASAIDACLADGFRHGVWQPTTAASHLACSNLTYVNTTCLPAAPLAAAPLCEALGGGGPLLMVGDSLLLKTWEALLQTLRLKKYDTEDCAQPTSKPAASRRARCQCCCKAFSIPCAGGKSVRVRFVRHNHLLGSFLPHGGAVCSAACKNDPDESTAPCLSCRRTLGARTLCDTWREPHTLAHAATLVLGTGSHLLEVPGHNASRLFARRADELAMLLAAHNLRRVVFVASSWGEGKHHSHYSGPNAPEPPASTYAWERIPAVNAEYARAMRERGYVVVDPSLAMQQRQDCRLDFMHSKPGVYAQATWRMLTAAFARLPPRK